mgnify:CR=1 FL=1
MTVKYIRIPDEVLDEAREQNKKMRMQYAAEHRERNNQRYGQRREGQRGGRNDFGQSNFSFSSNLLIHILFLGRSDSARSGGGRGGYRGGSGSNRNQQE